MSNKIHSSVARYALLAVVLAIGFFLIKPVLAQVATSTPTSTDQMLSATSSTDGSTASSTAATDTSASTTPSTATTTEIVATLPPADSLPAGLTLVHIIGEKYTDYFTDGTTETAYPGDAAIDAHLDVPHAPSPTHGNLRWVRTAGNYLYDTPSGDLEVGDYAVQSDGSYIQDAPPSIASTSTPVTPIPAATPSTSTPPLPLDTSTTSSPSPAENASTVTSSADTSATTTTPQP